MHPSYSAEHAGSSEGLSGSRQYQRRLPTHAAGESDEARAGDDLSRFKRKEIVAAIKKLAADNMANLFSNHELTKMDLLGIDLKNANLNHVDFEGAFLIETNFSGANQTLRILARHLSEMWTSQTLTSRMQT